MKKNHNFQQKFAISGIVNENLSTMGKKVTYDWLITREQLDCHETAIE